MESAPTMPIVPAVADDAAAIKSVVRDRWNIPERVAGWIVSDLNVEFDDPGCRSAWKEALEAAVGPGSGGAAVDIGTGPGTIAQLWAELGYATTGLDISPAMLDAARVRAAERDLTIHFMEGDAENPLVRSPHGFGVVSSRFVLYTLPHPGYALRHWVQLLHPGGTLVLIGHDRPDGTSGPLRQKSLARWQDEQHRDALSRLPFMHHKSADLIVLMEAVGMREIRRVPMEHVIDARKAIRRAGDRAGMPEAAPFLLAGRR